ncbi:DUF3331 domain-containing protein [Paraburkholderia pallida]|uniref:DUF3331 domain-containing protein n=1 Tax=Paraburkholderia pallida TaxID=2547399 RepID=A0A4P7DC93_9BURK|nr:DUF3331 domain-containing protein [Paraburkholderia pallida]QBR04332.1 DUF3331 domain-containing protein [Paraburkholderia pallida]
MKHTTQWSAIIASLSGYSGHVTVAGAAALPSANVPFRVPAKSFCNRGYPVVSIEKVDEEAILVSWSDATGGRYLDQNWRAGRSRGSGQCALTKMPIRKGDKVFRPFCRSKIHPSNSGEMIPASAIESLKEASAL